MNIEIRILNQILLITLCILTSYYILMLCIPQLRSKSFFKRNHLSLLSNTMYRLPVSYQTREKLLSSTDRNFYFINLELV